VPAGAARPTLKMAWVETGLREQGELSTASSAIWPQHKEDPAPPAAVPGPSVGAARFELATPCSQSRCATGLRHAPLWYFFLPSSHFWPSSDFPIRRTEYGGVHVEAIYP
jgi:hypothetical protein